MQKFALQIDRTNGREYHAFGTVGTDAHRQAEQIRDTWQELRAKDPRFYFTFVDPSGERTDIATGDITDVSLIVGGHMRGKP